MSSIAFVAFDYCTPTVRLTFGEDPGQLQSSDGNSFVCQKFLFLDLGLGGDTLQHKGN